MPWTSAHPFGKSISPASNSRQQAGTLITLGPTEGSTHVFGIYEAESREQVEALVKGDIYWREGIWTAVEIHGWIQAF